MNDQSIVVSVIVPVYNLEKVVARCIDSLIMQTYYRFEVIIIDDGSLDKSLVICKEYAQKDDRITVIHKENGGVSSARNLGISKARGNYIVFVDGDDFVLPTFLETIVNVFNNSDADIVVTRFASGDHEGLDYRVCEDISISGRYNSFDFEKLQYTSKNAYEHGMAMCVWGKGYKKVIFNNIQFEGRYSEDYAFTDLVNSQRYTVIIVDKIGYVYCYNPHSLVRSVSQAEKAVFLQILLRRLKLFAEDEYLIINTCKLFCNMYIEYYYNVKLSERFQIRKYEKQFDFCVATLKSKHLNDNKFYIRMYLFRFSPLLYQWINAYVRTLKNG